MADADDVIRALLGLKLHMLKAQAGRAQNVQPKVIPPQQRLSSDYLLVAAFDFGTTFSGYAFSFKTSKTDIKMNKNWGANVGFSSYKAPTCILLKPDQTFDSFGYEAQQKYANLVDSKDQDFYYFERFKMALHNNKKLNKDTRITATNGKAFPALDVFALSLKYLRNHLIDAVEKASESKADTKYIRWVITVPAIWTDASKQFMREAALKSGMITDLDSNLLIIALEPEAASLYCRTLNPKEFAQGGQGLDTQPGTKYLVLDAGGGTLDVTAHEIQSDGCVKELHYATGGPLGGTKVDDEFYDLLEKIFGKDFMKRFRRENASQWLQMLCEFEKKKRVVSKDDATTTNIPLMWSFAGKYQEISKKSVESAFQPCNVPGVTFSNGVICIPHNTANALFQPVVNGIVDHIRKLLSNPKLRGISYFFLVGGFAESSILQEAIGGNFGKNYKVLVPNEASLAVIKGAVQFGHNPSAVASRVAARTYGVELCTEFIQGKHDEKKAAIVDGKKHCKDVFQPFVVKGQEVPDGFSKTDSFKPVRDEQDSATVSIYSSDKEDVNYINEQGVSHNADIQVRWPGKGRGRTLEITMTFGGTEIHVQAVAFPGGDTASTKVNFFVQ